MATAKASMESPTPVRNNSMKPTANPFFPQGVNVSFSSRKKPSARRSATMESKSGGSTSGRPASELGRVQVGEHGRAGNALGSGEHAAGDPGPLLAAGALEGRLAAVAGAAPRGVRHRGLQVRAVVEQAVVPAARVGCGGRDGRRRPRPGAEAPCRLRPPLRERARARTPSARWSPDRRPAADRRRPPPPPPWPDRCRAAPASPRRSPEARPAPSAAQVSAVRLSARARRL